MKAFPLFLNVSGRKVVIVGGGEQAAQKARLAAKTEADLVFMAAELEEEIAARVADGAAHVPSVVDNAAFEGAALAFICTGCAGADAAISAVARDLGVIVNVVDRPDLCDVTTPAIVDRDPVVVAIGTEGAAPVLARQIKTQLEALLEPALGTFAAEAGRLRPRVERFVPKARRRAFWEWAFEGPRRLFTGGDRDGAMAAIERTLAAGGAVDEGGLVTLLDVSHGAADLVTLRAVARLQSADLILHDPDVVDGVLELARRDAERLVLSPIALGDAIGALRRAANDGQRAVLLAAGPWALPEIAALLAEGGVAVETVTTPSAAPVSDGLMRRLWRRVAD
ncbi:MAG: NAD(P)-dependent oxidoreductase [Pseudomonadota bacterium]